MKRLYQEIAVLLQAMENCRKSDNAEWLAKHGDKLESLVKEHMPSGSGVDSGTQLDMQRSTPDRLVFTTAFHHMHESGMYDGWTEHAVTVTPSLASGFDLKISGRDRNDIKDYLAEIFAMALRTEIKMMEPV
jgi:hypothetical protein